MRVAIPLFLALVLDAQGAAAQTTTPKTSPAAPSIDTVDVTAPKLVPPSLQKAIIHNFISTYTLPTPFLGRLARWNKPICPSVIGLNAKYSEFVLTRFKEIASRIGALVNPNASCKINMKIVFTVSPQAVMDDVQEHNPQQLGFHYLSQRKTVATVKFPIQAWYETLTENIFGGDLTIDCADEYDPKCSMGKYLDVTGGINDGLQSVFSVVTVIVDLNKVIGYQIGSVADYVTMLSLSQTQSFETCQAMPSIANLLAPNCDVRVTATALTDTDAAYLHALYSISKGVPLLRQRAAITDEMQKALASNTYNFPDAASRPPVNWTLTTYMNR